MNSVPKWLVAGGAALVIVGFLLPVVSFVVLVQMSISLSQIAGFGVPYLYLVPLGGLVTLVTALIPTNNRGTAVGLLVGQIAGLGISILALIGMVVSVLTQVQQVQSMFGGLIPMESMTAGIQLTPGIGSIVLILGYGVAVIGIVWEIFPLMGGFFQRKEPVRPMAQIPAPQISPAHPHPVVPGGARLEIVRGRLASQTIPLQDADFNIGRGSGNQLKLADPKVSRQHVRLRYAQGGWFIQDQNSSGGTFINGKRVQATRLNPGDEITIGENTFVFRM